MQLPDLGVRVDITLVLVAVLWLMAPGIGVKNMQADGLRYRREILRVTTVVFEPYVMLKTPPNGNTTDQVKYEGFIVDLMDKLADMMGFGYTLIPVKDGRYGYKRPNGKWDGMIGELRRGEADVAAAPMLVTERRAKVVDFTAPFMYVQATILIKKPSKGQNVIIKSVSDLLDQSEYTYGTQSTGIIKRTFRLSNSSLLQSLWTSMKTFEPTSFCKTNEQGIERVRREKYAYILPKPIADYIARRHPCDLTFVDKFLFNKGYAFAVPKDSHTLVPLSDAIKELYDNGFLKEIYKKWWYQRGDCNGIQSSKMYSISQAPVTCPCCHISLILLLLIWCSCILRNFHDSTDLTRHK